MLLKNRRVLEKITEELLEFEILTHKVRSLDQLRVKDVPNNLSAYKISSILFPRNGLQDLERIVHENGGIREKEPFFLSGTNYNEASDTTINPIFIKRCM